MVEIKGLEKFAPKDFPGLISSTVFVGGCNFRCPFCHNVDLVLRPHILPNYPLDYFKNFLEKRKDWLDGICISGGEPLIHSDLEEFLQLIKEMGILVKVDTNGSYPQRLERFIQNKLVDHVAMDIKAPLSKYRLATNTEVELENIQTSISLLMSSEIQYTFRTTVVPGLIEEEDIDCMGRMLQGAHILQLQQFVPDQTLDESYQKKKPYSMEKLQRLAQKAKYYFDEIRIEGVGK